ncbi:ATP-binding SpoIIE family protein phosphatase [Paenibacillus spongiae]|uniref:SpoIIE family protein phosphatase n=1 Tax=Paenibacillus spongiae TaxID=2909671 RepID=A0ABY5S7F9_9BACL|nr:SpoIIE family protein phosphatase [Paenibacillus spongiae]UVI29856.1 SpoIIE family protein phosphatase [Paenibacillus spongiae]
MVQGEPITGGYSHDLQDPQVSYDKAAPTSAQLRFRLFGVYMFSLLAGIIIIVSEHMLVMDIPFQQILTLSLPAMLIGAVVLSALLTALSIWRLRPVFRIRSVEPADDGASDESAKALNRLLAHPCELLVAMIVFGLVYTSLFHWKETAFRNDTLPSIDWTVLVGSIAREISLSLTIGIFIFTSIRRLLLPLVLRFQPQSGQWGGRGSIVSPLIITYSSTFLIAVLNLFQLAVLADSSGEPQSPMLIGGVGLFYFILGVSLIGYISLQFRKELRTLVRNIQQLGGGGRKLGSRMPVVSYDEAGELASAFNELQTRIDREYESLERELKLAYNVQQKLLPPGDLTIGSYRIAARCQPYRNVGGDFFDVLMLGPSRFAIMIGDVSGKGVPAALLMSALLLLFRAEIRRNGNPAEVLARMNRQLCEAMGDDGAVTLGVGVIDTTSDTVRYASAGHLSPYIVSPNGSIVTVDCSSLPIGFDAEVVYQETQLQLNPGDRFVLYTDGIIESMDEGGHMYGFDGLEEEISSWKPCDDLPQLVDGWLARMDAHSTAGKDDRTIVVLELVQAYRSQTVQREAISGGHLSELLPSSFFSQEWLLRSRMGSERGVAEQIGSFITKFWPETNLHEDVQSAVAEAIMNAMEHGNKLDPMAQVTVQAQIGSLLAVIRVYDEGGGYFPHVSRDEKEMAKKRESDDPRGWGLVIIDSLSDYWATGRDERGFYMELYFMRITNT